MKKFFTEYMWYKKIDLNKVYRGFYINATNSFNPKYNIYSLYNNFKLLYQWNFDNIMIAKHFIDSNYSFLLDLDK